MEMARLAQIGVYAGTGWDGQVVFTVVNPDNGETESDGDYETIVKFCSKHNLKIPTDFESMVKTFLVYRTLQGSDDRRTESSHRQKMALGVPEFEELSPGNYLKQHFLQYYGAPFLHQNNS